MRVLRLAVPWYVVSYGIGMDVSGVAHLRCILSDGGNTALKDESQFVGFVGDEPSSILLRHNGLHLDILIDRADPVGAVNPAGVKDVMAESALTTIQDCEDSVTFGKGEMNPTCILQFKQGVFFKTTGDIEAQWTNGANVSTAQSNRRLQIGERNLSQRGPHASNICKHGKSHI